MWHGVLCGLAFSSQVNANTKTIASITATPASLKNDQIISRIVWLNSIKTKLEKAITEMYVIVNGFRLLKKLVIFIIYW